MNEATLYISRKVSAAHYLPDNSRTCGTAKGAEKYVYQRFEKRVEKYSLDRDFCGRNFLAHPQHDS